MKGIFTIFLILCCQICIAKPGLLFNVTTSGNIVTISPTIPHNYPFAGIKLNTQGYTLKNPGTDCILHPNGYCLFATSPTNPVNITINGATGFLNTTLCLDGKGPLSC